MDAVDQYSKMSWPTRLKKKIQFVNVVINVTLIENCHINTHFVHKYYLSYKTAQKMVETTKLSCSS